MAINYKPVPKKNPGNQAAPAKYYAQTVSAGDVSLRQLAKMISEVATVKTADTMAVLEGLLNVLPMALGDGKIVRLGDFGSFSVSVNSDGVETADALTAVNITKTSVKFRPGKEFSHAISQFQYNKVSQP
jgi:predicted histone-like DNA-binding protein